MANSGSICTGAGSTTENRGRSLDSLIIEIITLIEVPSLSLSLYGSSEG